jgi:predicted alpha/beta superfamily hydrolase
MNKHFNSILFALFFALTSLLFFPGCTPSDQESRTNLKFEISFPEEAYAENITGRVYVIISNDDSREPRLQISTMGQPFWGEDVEGLAPGAAAVIDGATFGYPLESLADLPPGEYNVQGFVNIYTKFERSDGHTLWMPNDQWEGQHFNRSPGNLYSDVQKITIDPAKGGTIRLDCKNVIPPIEVPEDTEWVKRIKFKSEMLSEFWGQDIFLGATILLPKGYEENPDSYYPVNYIQGHFSLGTPNRIVTEDPGDDNPRAKAGYDFFQFWNSDEAPRMIAVTFQHPCPYYDDSYAVNSPNTGPYGDAIMQELIPRVEEQFRIIREPYARILSGGSTGGWESLALQIMNPDFFGGTFSTCPDPVDFNYFQAVNIYEDENAYYKNRGWLKVPTPSDRYTDGMIRLTYEQRNHYELVRGTKGRSGEQVDIFEAVFGPIGEDGYVKELFNQKTGEIDQEVAAYWKENYDLHQYLRKNWETIGPKLVGKLHIYTGDMDTYYLNPAVELLEEYLEKTNPYYEGVVEYGDGEPHCWGPDRKDLQFLMAEQVKKNAPMPANTAMWNY